MAQAGKNWQAVNTWNRGIQAIGWKGNNKATVEDGDSLCGVPRQEVAEVLEMKAQALMQVGKC